MKVLILVSTVLLVAGCATIVLEPADFSWPVETVLMVNANGFISEERHTFDINTKPIFYEEFSDSNSYAGREIRIIRNKEGYYYLTGEGFKNIYMLQCIEGGMKLKKKLTVSDSLALKMPVLNQKLNGIELIDGSNKYLIYGSEIVRAK